MSTRQRQYIAADAYGRSFYRIDLAAHLASGRPVEAGHIATTDPRSVPASWGWPIRLFEITGGSSNGLSLHGFHVVEEHPSHLILGEHGRSVATILERPATAELLTSDLTVRRSCLDLLQTMRDSGLTAAQAVIEETCRGWTVWALEAMRASTGDPHARFSRRMPDLGFVAA